MVVTVGALYASTSELLRSCPLYKSAELLFKVGVIVRIYNYHEQCYQQSRGGPIPFREETGSGDPLYLI